MPKSIRVIVTPEQAQALQRVFDGQAGEDAMNMSNSDKRRAKRLAAELEKGAEIQEAYSAKGSEASTYVACPACPSPVRGGGLCPMCLRFIANVLLASTDQHGQAPRKA